MANKFRDDSAIKMMMQNAVVASDCVSDDVGESRRIQPLVEAEDMNLRSLPLVPSSAMFITRDMLTGYASKVNLEMSEDEKATNGPEHILELNFQPDCRTEGDQYHMETPQKGNDVRSTAPTVPRVMATGTASSGPRWSDAPVKAPSAERAATAETEKNNLDTVKIRPTDLFGIQ